MLANKSNVKSHLSEQTAKQFQMTVEQLIHDEQQIIELPNDVVQTYLAYAIKLYVAKLDNDIDMAPFEYDMVTATEVVKTATNMLEAADLEIFELGMWKALGK